MLGINYLAAAIRKLAGALNALANTATEANVALRQRLRPECARGWAGAHPAWLPSRPRRIPGPAVEAPETPPAVSTAGGHRGRKGTERTRRPDPLQPPSPGARPALLAGGSFHVHFSLIVIEAVAPDGRRRPLRWLGRTLCGAYFPVAKAVPIIVRSSARNAPRGRCKSAQQERLPQRRISGGTSISLRPDQFRWYRPFASFTLNLLRSAEC